MSSKQKIIIDGYNLMHADPEIKNLIEQDLEEARGELIDLLEKYLRTRQVQMTLVFDGRGRMMDAESRKLGVFQIVFSPSYQSADEFIITSIREAANPREYMVVTSDNADIGRAARAAGASVVPSDEFARRLRKRGSPAARNGEKPQPGEEDLSYWLEQFKKHDCDNNQ